MINKELTKTINTIMNKIWLTLFLFLSVTVRSQEILPYFLTMPEAILPYLNGAQRKTMVDLFNAKRTPTVANSFGTASTLKQLDDHRLLIQLSDRSTFEMCILPFEKKDVKIVTIETFEMDKQPYSLLKCYSGLWTLDGQIGVLPKPMNAETFRTYFSNRSKRKYEELLSYSIRYRFDQVKESVMEEARFVFATDRMDRNDSISLIRPLNLKVVKQ